MTTENYEINVLDAVCKVDKQQLNELYSKDVKAFVSAAFRLYKNGLISTVKKNFVEGDSGLVPVDVVNPDNFKSTPPPKDTRIGK